MTGRRPDYTVFREDIGVIDATKNRCLFAVTSTTCPTLLKQILRTSYSSFAVFSPPDIQQGLVQHSKSVSVPIHPSDKSSEWPQASRQAYIYTSHIRGILDARGVWVVFSGVRWRGSWHFQVASWHLQSIMDLRPLHTIFYFSFLSKRSGRRKPPAERSALYVVPGIIFKAPSGLTRSSRVLR